MASKKLEFSTRLTREDVAGLVEALIEGLKDGLLKVQKSDEVLEMPVPRVVDLEIEAEIDDERAEFEIEVSWRTNAENPDNVPENPAETVRTGAAAKKTGARSKEAAGKKAAPAKKAAPKKTAAAKSPARSAKSATAQKQKAGAKKTTAQAPAADESGENPS